MSDPAAPPAARRFLVVGCGFIGAHFVHALLAAGAETRVLTRSEPDADVREALGEDLIVADAAEGDAVGASLAGVTHVVYAAGGRMPAQSEADPAADARLTFPPLVRVLESLGRGTSLTLISSGGTVYGEPQRLPVDETHPTEPLSAYGVIKLAAEKLVAMYARRNGFSARILRCANVYGEGQPVDRGQGVVAVFTARALAGEPAVVYGDGRTIRDYVYVGDVVDAALALAERPSRPEIVNVGSGHGYSVNEIVAAVERAADRRLALDRRPARDFDVSEIVLDITRLRALTAFEPTSLDDGVRRTLEAQVRQTAAEPHTAAR